MNSHPATFLFERLTELSYVGRCPSWAEYENGSPSEQRAISTRWCQIIHRMGGKGDEQFREQAMKNYARYCAGKVVQLYRSPADAEFESAQERFYRGESGPDTSEDQGL